MKIDIDHYAMNARIGEIVAIITMNWVSFLVPYWVPNMLPPAFFRFLTAMIMLQLSCYVIISYDGNKYAIWLAKALLVVTLLISVDLTLAFRDVGYPPGTEVKQGQIIKSWLNW